MATKLDTTRRLFMGPTPSRENTVVDHIRKAVAELDSGEGVEYSALEDYLLANYTPAKSTNYGPSFVKSYVRDGVNKYGHLSYENEGHAYFAEASPLPKGPRAKRITKAQMEINSILTFILTAGQVAGEDDVDNTNITTEDLAQELGRRKDWVESRLETATTEGLARVEDEEGKKVAYLTAEGYRSLANSTTEQTSAEAAEEASEPDEDTERDYSHAPEEEEVEAATEA